MRDSARAWTRGSTSSAVSRRPRRRVLGSTLAAAAAALLLALPAAASADFPLTIETKGTGTGTVKCAVGAGPVEACDSEYPEGTELTLIPEATLGSEFIDWSGDCGPLACELTMNQNHTAIATFDLEPGVVMFELAVKKTGTGTGTVQCEADFSPAGTCQATYPEGTEVTVLAEADPGSKFTGFSGDCSGKACELTMDDDKSVTANFDPEPVSEFALTIAKAGTGAGTVLCEVQEGPQACQAKYPEGTEVTLLPTASPGSEFIGFSGDCTGPSCALTMDKAHSVTATFDLEAGPEEFFALTIATAGTGTGTVKCKVDGGEAKTCDPEYKAGAKLSLIATASPGSTFANYSAGTGSATGCSISPCNFTINADSSVTATFNLEAGPKEFALTIATAGTGTGTIMCEVDEGLEDDCDAKYPEGTKVTVLAEPDSGSNFAGWSGDCSGTGACNLTMNAPHSVTAKFDLVPVVEFTLTVNLKGTGSGTVLCEAQEGPETCKAKYPDETELTLLATANPGSKFTGFSGACSGLTCEVTMSANRTVNVTFDAIPKFTLKVKKTGTGTGKVTSSPTGINCGADCEEAYEEGKEVTLTATADAGSEFVKWSGACTGSGSCKVTMTAAREVTAEFKLTGAKPKFTLKVKKTGTGTGKVTSSPAGINCGSDCEEAYEEGKVVTLTQVADPGSEFVKWRGACFGTETCKVTMDAAKEVTAEFKLTFFTLTVEKLGTGTGKVTSSPAGIECGSDCEEAYEAGKKVTLTAAADEGSAFDHWTGGGCTGAEPCVVTMTVARKVKAVFKAVGQRTLTVFKAGSGSGTVTSAPKGIDCGSTCTASYNVGKKVTLIPVAATNSTFTGFSGACTGTTPCVVTMSEARSVTATFEADPDPQSTVGLVVVAGTAKAKNGKALLRIFCNGPSACEGELKLLLKVAPRRSVVIGKAPFKLQPGASTTLKIPLSRRAVAALENRKALQARVVGTGIHAHVVRLKNVS